MINHEAALQAALIARLRGDDALDALVAGRVWDGEPAKRRVPLCDRRPGARAGRCGRTAAGWSRC